MSMNQRTKYVAAHIKPEVKKLLIKMAFEDGTSVSNVISRILDEALKEKLNEDKKLRRRQ